MNRQAVWTSIVLGVAVCAACAGPPPEAPSPSLDVPPVGPQGRDAKTEPAVASTTTDDVTRGVAAIKAGDWTGARAAFEAAIRKNARHGDAFYYLGLVMEKTGDKAAAEKHYKKAIDLQPDLQEAAENLTAMYVESKKFDDALAIASRSLARNSKNAELQLNLAVALSGKGDVDGASKAFETAVALAPNDPRFYLAFAEHLGGAKKMEEAVEKLKQAQRSGDDAAMLGTIGFSFRTARAVPECVAAFDKAIALKDNADFRTNRAMCKLAAKDRAGALADLRVATSKEPAFAPAHYWLATILHDDGKFSEAAASYAAYLAAAPNGPMAKAADAKMKLAKEKKRPKR